VAVPEPAAFADALPQYGLATRYSVNNEGVNGTTACELLNGTDGRHPAWAVQMANSAASFVIINHAINDSQQEAADQYAGCLTQLVQQARSRGKTVILETPNPTKYGELDTFVAVMKNVANQQGVAVIDEYRYLNDYLNGASVYQICPDGIHPTDDIYKMKGQYAAQNFARLYP
jgi:hypothetical protein